MKTLHIPLEEKEFKILKNVKGKRTWKEFIFELVEKEGDQK